MPLTARRPSQELIDLVGTLGGSWSGYVAMVRCPAHNDSEPSLSLRQGDHGILVTCFAGCDRLDVLRELRRVHRRGGFPEPCPTGPSKPRTGEHIWDQAIEIPGTLGERYLMRRSMLPTPPDVRFHPRCPYLPRPRTIYQPALIIAVREARTLVAIQRIFLDAVTANHVRKIMLGTPRSGAWRGRGLASTLAIAEGFETAEAFTRIHDVPCWASLGARRLDQLAIPQTVETLLIAEDNDAEGRRAAAAAEARYARPGLTIRRAPPARKYKDWAETLDDLSLRNA
ncbi:DUF7146 domain-containing protein [Sphingobium chungangianum]